MNDKERSLSFYRALKSWAQDNIEVFEDGTVVDHTTNNVLHDQCNSPACDYQPDNDSNWPWDGA